MESLELQLKSSSHLPDAEPKIFDLKNESDQKDVAALLARSPRVLDFYQDQLEELFVARNPDLKVRPQERPGRFQTFLQERKARGPLWQQGVWVHFPWKHTLNHLLAAQEFAELQTSRNRNLITAQEQETLRKFRVGISGMSVGSNAALALTLEGAANFRLADFDVLGLSNLNRIRASVNDIGAAKVVMTARQMYEINPFAQLTLFQNGLQTEADLERSIMGPQPLQVFVDEMDDVVMKLRLRELARQAHIPVVSAADNGDNVIVDVERFDLESARPLYHGRLGDVTSEQVKSFGFGQRFELINNMVGVEHVTERMKLSLLEVGRTLYTWPQLGGAAMLSGGVVAYLVKAIALGYPLPSGKYEVNLDSVFVPGYSDSAEQARRQGETEMFLQKQQEMIQAASR